MKLLVTSHPVIVLGYQILHALPLLLGAQAPLHLPCISIKEILQGPHGSGTGTHWAFHARHSFHTLQLP